MNDKAIETPCETFPHALAGYLTRNGQVGNLPDCQREIEDFMRAKPESAPSAPAVNLRCQSCNRDLQFVVCPTCGRDNFELFESVQEEVTLPPSAAPESDTRGEVTAVLPPLDVTGDDRANAVMYLYPSGSPKQDAAVVLERSRVNCRERQLKSALESNLLLREENERLKGEVVGVREGYEAYRTGILEGVDLLVDRLHKSDSSLWCYAGGTVHKAFPVTSLAFHGSPAPASADYLRGKLDELKIENDRLQTSNAAMRRRLDDIANQYAVDCL